MERNTGGLRGGGGTGAELEGYIGGTGERAGCTLREENRVRKGTDVGDSVQS